MARGYSKSTYDAAARPSSTSGDSGTPSNSALARSASPIRKAARPSALRSSDSTSRSSTLAVGSVG